MEVIISHWLYPHFQLMPWYTYFPLFHLLYPILTDVSGLLTISPKIVEKVMPSHNYFHQLSVMALLFPKYLIIPTLGKELHRLAL